jgi:hypothetical protein
MADATTTETFTVKSGEEEISVEYEVPTSLDSPRFAEILRTGSEEEIVDAANTAILTSLKAGIRSRLGNVTEDEMASYIENYRYGVRQGGGPRSVKLTSDVASEAGFSDDQLEVLRKLGVKMDD